MSKTNFLQETISQLSSNGKTMDDVISIFTTDFELTKEEFIKLFDIEYDSGYGGQEMPDDIIILGKDWWMERWEYDGSEGWNFRKQVKPPKTKFMQYIKKKFKTSNIDNICWNRFHNILETKDKTEDGE